MFGYKLKKMKYIRIIFKCMVDKLTNKAFV